MPRMTNTDTDTGSVPVPVCAVDEVASKIVEVLEGDRSRMVFMPRALYGLSYLVSLGPRSHILAARPYKAEQSRAECR